jgi:hypothetical protein
LALTSTKRGGRSVGIVRSRTQATEIFFVFMRESVYHIMEIGLLKTPLWLKKRFCWTIFSESLKYRISTKYVKRLVLCLEKSFYDHIHYNSLCINRDKHCNFHILVSGIVLFRASAESANGFV